MCEPDPSIGRMPVRARTADSRAGTRKTMIVVESPGSAKGGVAQRSRTTGARRFLTDAGRYYSSGIPALRM